MTRALRRLRGAVLALGGLSVAGSARASEPCAPSGPWVQVDLTELSAGLDARAVLERLALDLASRGIALCASASPAPSSPPLATVSLSPAEGTRPGAVLLDVEVRDRVTRKRVAREVDLSTIPADGRSIVVALAADELLRASWAELALEPEEALPPRPLLPAPEAVAVRRALGALGARSPRPFSLGLRGAASLWTAGLFLYGADAALALRLPGARWLRLELSAGARAATARQAPSGEISGRTLSARLGAHAALVGDPEVFALSLGARLGAHSVRFAGEPSGAGIGRAGSALALSAELGPALSLRISEGARLVLDLAGALPLRAVTARDSGQVATGLSGLGGEASLGILAEI